MQDMEGFLKGLVLDRHKDEAAVLFIVQAWQALCRTVPREIQAIHWSTCKEALDRASAR